MPLTPSAGPALPAEWTDALDRIQRVLADALQAVDARARALEENEIPESRGAQRVSAGMEHTLAYASGSATATSQQAAEIEASLATAQAALDGWLATAAQVGQRLAEQAARAV